MSKYSTKQRELLLLYLSEHVDEKISVKQIEEALKKEKIILSAIYRNLAEIEKNGHLKRFAKKNQSILTMDSIQSKTSNDVKNGTTYISVMENNLDVLKKALN